MASLQRETFETKSPENDRALQKTEFIQTQVSPVQYKEDNSNCPVSELNILPIGNGSCAKQELQYLWEIVHLLVAVRKTSQGSEGFSICHGAVL